MAQDINKLGEEADKNCQEMIKLLKECVEILDRMENTIDKAIKKQMKELGGIK